MLNMGIIIAAAVLIGLIVLGLIFSRLYIRSTKERSFVRTGLGGQKVIMDGGAIVLPIVQDIIPVNMNTLKLEVSRKDGQALITKDRLRVDVLAEFYVKVGPSIEAISNAAQTLGTKTLEPTRLKELIEGKFVDALRTVAAEMNMEELHENRSDFVQRVQSTVNEDLEKNGLELETVSLTGLDQTDKQWFNPDNAFDAEGLTKLTEAIEAKRKTRNDIERDTAILIQKKDLESEKESLTLKRDEEYARLAQEQEISLKRAEQKAIVAKEEAEKRRESEVAQITAEEKIESQRISKDKKLAEEEIAKSKSIEEHNIAKAKALELAMQDKEIEISEKAKAESLAKSQANEARAQEVATREKIKTASDTEVANRERSLALIKAEQEAEEGAIELKVAAEAEKIAALDRAEAIKEEAQGEANAIKIKAEAQQEFYKVEAEGTSQINEAANKLSADQIAMQVQMKLIEKIPEIMEQVVKPMEQIDSIKIVEMGGVANMVNGETGSTTAVEGSLSDQIVNSALKYQTQAPLLKDLLAQVGLETDSINGILNSISQKEQRK
jgi:uncharacterized membrane protein YqiK